MTLVKVIGTAMGRDANFPTGKDISVKDQHLYVYESGGAVIAIFAPGAWRDAVVETQKSN